MLDRAREALYYEVAYPFSVVWKLEARRLTVFAIAAFVLSQLQLVGIFFFSLGPRPAGIALSQAMSIAIEQQLAGANFYLFSATLLLSTCASLGSEWLDSPSVSTVKDTWKWRFYGWALAALVLAIIQTIAASQLNSAGLQKALAQSQPATELLTASNTVQILLWLATMVFVTLFFSMGRLRHHPNAQDDMDKRTRAVIQKARDVQQTTDREQL